MTSSSVDRFKPVERQVRSGRNGGRLGLRSSDGTYDDANLAPKHHRKQDHHGSDCNIDEIAHGMPPVVTLEVSYRLTGKTSVMHITKCRFFPIAAHRGNLFLADTGVHQIGDEGAGVHPLGSGYRSGPNRLTWCRHRKWETISGGSVKSRNS